MKIYILEFIKKNICPNLSYYVLNKINISANAITFLSILIAFLVLFFLSIQIIYIGSILACLWCLLDNMDGELARLQNSSSILEHF